MTSSHTMGFDHAQEQVLRATLDAIPDAITIQLPRSTALFDDARPGRPDRG